MGCQSVPEKRRPTGEHRCGGHFRGSEAHRTSALSDKVRALRTFNRDRLLPAQPSGHPDRPCFGFSFQAFRPVLAILKNISEGPQRPQLEDPLGDWAYVDLTVQGTILTLEYDTYDNATVLSAPIGQRAALESLRELLDTADHPILEEQL